MDILKKSIAPITDAAWKEITKETARILKINLTAREFVDIEGPTGLKQGGISTGRLNTPSNQSEEGINYGLRDILPFVEIRKPFELDIWELDNANRGAKDTNLKPLGKAAKEMALFEENAIYSGFEAGGIKGLEKNAASKKTVLPEDPNEFLKLMGAQKIEMQKDGIEGPYYLIVNGSMWQDLINLSKGYPVLKQLQEIIEGRIILNYNNSNSFLVSARGEDFELTLGQDISIGYESHTTEKVQLYFTESFTFRVLSPEAVRVFTNRKLS